MHFLCTFQLNIFVIFNVWALAYIVLYSKPEFPSFLSLLQHLSIKQIHTLQKVVVFIISHF